MNPIQSKIQYFSLLSLVCAKTSVDKFAQNVVHTDALEMCAGEIVLSKTLHGADIAIITDDKLENYLIKRLHESYNVKTFLKDYDVSLNISPNVYLVHCDGKNNLEHIIGNLSRDWYRKTNALYIIVLKNVSKNDLPAIFRVLWTHNIVHVLITIKDADEDASIYSYLPYAAGRCGRDYNNTVKIGRCQSHAAWDVVERIREYDKPDLRNCTFNILAYHYPPLVFSDPNPTDRFAVGIERFLVELLLEAEHISPNFTFVPETASFGEITKNFTVTGIMKKLHENEVDLLFGGFSLNYKRALLFDFSSIHLAFEDVFTPVTPNVKLVHRWKIYMMFENKVWFLLLLTIILCSALLSGFDYLSKLRHSNSSELLNLIGNATQNVTLNLREKLYENVVIIHWLWFMFLVSCYYQSRLTSYSVYRTYEPQINEYMSLQSYNLTPCLSRAMAEFLISSEIVPIIHEKHLDTKSCETADLALDEVARSSSKYTVTIYYKYLWWASKHMKEKSQIHVMHENIYKTHYALFFKRGFPLLAQFERRMTHIVECGFVQAIKGLLRFPNEVRYGDNSGAFQVRHLTLYDLILPFGMLVAGHLFALVIFIIEILHVTDKTIVLFQR